MRNYYVRSLFISEAERLFSEIGLQKNPTELYFFRLDERAYLSHQLATLRLNFTPHGYCEFCKRACQGKLWDGIFCCFSRACTFRLFDLRQQQVYA